MAMIDHFNLKGANPQVYALGVKEIWEVPNPLDRVIHTMGWPLRGSRKYSEFGGSFIYPMGLDKVCIGLVVGLDYTDATLSVHDLLEFDHPLVKEILTVKTFRQRLGRKRYPKEDSTYSRPLACTWSAFIGES
jgi:electron-transferring-flavoprotein dehydrogenase